MALQTATLLAAATSTACTSAEGELARWQHRDERVLAALDGRQDADALAATALITTALRKPGENEWMARAVAAAPQRADLQWLQIQLCGKTASCATEAMEARLHLLAPENGASWLPALARAGTAGDEEAKRTLIQSIARSSRIETYWTELIAGLTPPLEQTRVMSTGDAVASVTGVLAALSLPAYSLISTACKGENLDSPGALEACRGVARAFQNGDTWVTAGLGAAFVKRVWPVDSPEYRQAVAERRESNIRNLAAGRQMWTERHARRFLALCGQFSREQDVTRALTAKVTVPSDLQSGH